MSSLAMLAFLHLVRSTPADQMSGPAEAKTTAEIVAAAAEDDLRGGLRREARVSVAEYRGRDLQAFAAWYNPYSGEAACHVYVYARDEKKGVWVRKVAKVFHGTQNVSVEFGRAVTIRDVKGKVIGRYPEE